MTTNRYKKTPEDLPRGITNKERTIKESIEMTKLIEQLPYVSPPRNFEAELYTRLGISYVPFHRKALLLTGLSAFATFVYFSINWLYKFVFAKIHPARLSTELSALYVKLLRFITFIKIGANIKDIYLVFINPLFILTFIFVSSISIWILIKLFTYTKSDEVTINLHMLHNNGLQKGG